MSASAHSSASSSALGTGCEDEPERVRVGEGEAIEDDVAWSSSGSESPGSKLEGKPEEASTKEPKPSDSVLAWPEDSETEPLPRRRSDDSGEAMLMPRTDEQESYYKAMLRKEVRQFSKQEVGIFVLQRVSLRQVLSLPAAELAS